MWSVSSLTSALCAILSLLLLTTPASADRCQCTINGQCFAQHQVALYNVEKCYRLACTSSSVGGSRMEVEDVAACGQCCERDGDIYPLEASVTEESGCVVVCQAGNSWSQCGTTASPGGAGSGTGGGTSSGTGGGTGGGTSGGTGGGATASGTTQG